MVIDVERNILINPRHREAAGIRLISDEPFSFDPRLCQRLKSCLVRFDPAMSAVAAHHRGTPDSLLLILLIRQRSRFCTDRTELSTCP